MVKGVTRTSNILYQSNDLNFSNIKTQSSQMNDIQYNYITYLIQLYIEQ